MTMDRKTVIGYCPRCQGPIFATDEKQYHEPEDCIEFLKVCTSNQSETIIKLLTNAKLMWTMMNKLDIQADDLDPETLETVSELLDQCSALEDDIAILVNKLEMAAGIRPDRTLN